MEADKRWRLVIQHLTIMTLSSHCLLDRLWFEEEVLFTFCPNIWNPMKELIAVFSWLVTAPEADSIPVCLGWSCSPFTQHSAPWPCCHVSLSWSQANSTLEMECPCSQPLSVHAFLSLLSLEMLTFAHCDISMWKQETGKEKLLVVQWHFYYYYFFFLSAYGAQFHVCSIKAHGQCYAIVLTNWH